MDTDSLEDTDSSFEDMSQPGRAAAGFPTQHSAQPAVRSIQEEEERRPLYRTPFGPTRSSGTPQGYQTAAEAAAQGPGTGAGPPGFSFGGDGSEEDLGTPTSIPNPLFSEREESQTLEDERAWCSPAAVNDEMAVASQLDALMNAAWHGAMPSRSGGKSVHPTAADTPVTPAGRVKPNFRDYHDGPGSHSLRKNELFDLHEDSRRPSTEEPYVSEENLTASSGKVVPTLTEQFKLSSSLGRVNRDAGALVRHQQQQQHEEEQAQRLEASRAECRVAKEQVADVQGQLEASRQECQSAYTKLERLQEAAERGQQAEQALTELREECKEAHAQLGAMQVELDQLQQSKQDAQAAAEQASSDEAERRELQASMEQLQRALDQLQLLATNATSEYESSEQRAQQYNQEEVQVHEAMLAMAVSERQQMQLLLTEVNGALGLALEAKEAAQMEAAAQKAALEEERSNSGEGTQKLQEALRQALEDLANEKGASAQLRQRLSEVDVELGEALEAREQAEQELTTEREAKVAALRAAAVDDEAWESAQREIEEERAAHMQTLQDALEERKGKEAALKDLNAQCQAEQEREAKVQALQAEVERHVQQERLAEERALALQAEAEGLARKMQQAQEQARSAEDAAAAASERVRVLLEEAAGRDAEMQALQASQASSELAAQTLRRELGGSQDEAASARTGQVVAADMWRAWQQDLAEAVTSLQRVDDVQGHRALEVRELDVRLAMLHHQQQQRRQQQQLVEQCHMLEQQVQHQQRELVAKCEALEQQLASAADSQEREGTPEGSAAKLALAEQQLHSTAQELHTTRAAHAELQQQLHSTQAAHEDLQRQLLATLQHQADADQKQAQRMRSLEEGLAQASEQLQQQQQQQQADQPPDERANQLEQQQLLLQQYQTQVEDYQAQVEQYQAQVEELRQRLEELQQQHAASMTHSTEEELQWERHAASSAREEELQQQVEELQQQHAACTARVEDVGQQVDTARKLQAAAQAEAEDMAQQLEQAQQQQAASAAQVEDLQQQLEQAQEQHAACTAHTEELQLQLEQARQQHAACAAQLEDMAQQLEQAQQQHAACAAQAEDLQQQLERAQQQHEAAVASQPEQQQQQMRSALQREKTLRAQAEDLRALVKQLQEQDTSRQAHAQEDHDAKEQCSVLQLQVADLQQQLNTTKQRQSVRTTAGAEELERAQADVQWLQRHNLRLEEALSSSHAQQGVLEEEIHALEQELVGERLHRQELQASTPQQEDAQHASADALAKERGRAQELQAELSQLQEQSAAADMRRLWLEDQAQGERLRDAQQVSELRSRCAEWQSRWEGLQKELNQKEQAMQQLAARHAELEGDLRLAEDGLEIHVNRCQDLQQELAELDNNNRGDQHRPGEAKKLRSGLEARESQLERTGAELGAAKKEISRLTEDAAVQCARIERLEAALRTAQQYIKGKARPHEQGLDYKQPHAQLVLLQLEMLQQSTVADGLRQQLDRQNARVAELQCALDHQKPAKESLLRALEEQCSHAAELQRALAQQEARVEELQGEVEQQRAHVAELQGDLSREQAMCEALAAALEQSEEAQANAKRDPSVPSSAADATTAAAPGTPTAAAAAEDSGPSQEVGAASGAHGTHPPKAVETGIGTRTGTATATPGMCAPGAALHGTQHAARQGHPHSGKSPESGPLGVFGGPAGAAAAAAAAAQDAGSTQPCSDAAGASGNQLKRGAGTDSKSATERRSSDYNSGMGNMSTQGLAMRSSKDRHLRESEMLTSSYSFKEERPPMGTEALGNGVVAEAAGGPHGAVQNGSHAPEQGMRDHVREMESVLAVAVAGRSAAESEAAALQQELAEACKLSHQEQQQKQQHVDMLEWRLVETEARLNSLQEAHASERLKLQVEADVLKQQVQELRNTTKEGAKVCMRLTEQVENLAANVTRQALLLEEANKLQAALRATVQELQQQLAEADAASTPPPDDTLWWDPHHSSGIPRHTRGITNGGPDSDTLVGFAPRTLPAISSPTNTAGSDDANATIPRGALGSSRGPANDAHLVHGKERQQQQQQQLEQQQYPQYHVRDIGGGVHPTPLSVSLSASPQGRCVHLRVQPQAFSAESAHGEQQQQQRQQGDTSGVRGIAAVIAALERERVGGVPPGGAPDQAPDHTPDQTPDQAKQGRSSRSERTRSGRSEQLRARAAGYSGIIDLAAKLDAVGDEAADNGSADGSALKTSTAVAGGGATGAASHEGGSSSSQEAAGPRQHSKGPLSSKNSPPSSPQALAAAPVAPDVGAAEKGKKQEVSAGSTEDPFLHMSHPSTHNIGPTPSTPAPHALTLSPHSKPSPAAQPSPKSLHASPPELFLQVTPRSPKSSFASPTEFPFHITPRSVRSSSSYASPPEFPIHVTARSPVQPSPSTRERINQLAAAAAAAVAAGDDAERMLFPACAAACAGATSPHRKPPLASSGVSPTSSSGRASSKQQRRHHHAKHSHHFLSTALVPATTPATTPLHHSAGHTSISLAPSTHSAAPQIRAPPSATARPHPAHTHTHTPGPPRWLSEKARMQFRAAQHRAASAAAAAAAAASTQPHPRASKRPPPRAPLSIMEMQRQMMGGMGGEMHGDVSNRMGSTLNVAGDINTAGPLAQSGSSSEPPPSSVGVQPGSGHEHNAADTAAAAKVSSLQKGIAQVRHEVAHRLERVHALEQQQKQLQQPPSQQQQHTPHPAIKQLNSELQQLHDVLLAYMQELQVATLAMNPEQQQPQPPEQQQQQSLLRRQPPPPLTGDAPAHPATHYASHQHQQSPPHPHPSPQHLHSHPLDFSSPDLTSEEEDDTPLATPHLKVSADGAASAAGVEGDGYRPVQHQCRSRSRGPSPLGLPQPLEYQAGPAELPLTARKRAYAGSASQEEEGVLQGAAAPEGGAESSRQQHHHRTQHDTPDHTDHRNRHHHQHHHNRHRHTVHRHAGHQQQQQDPEMGHSTPHHHRHHHHRRHRHTNTQHLEEESPQGETHSPHPHHRPQQQPLQQADTRHQTAGLPFDVLIERARGVQVPPVIQERRERHRKAHGGRGNGRNEGNYDNYDDPGTVVNGGSGSSDGGRASVGSSAALMDDHPLLPDPHYHEHVRFAQGQQTFLLPSESKNGDNEDAGSLHPHMQLQPLRTRMSGHDLRISKQRPAAPTPRRAAASRAPSPASTVNTQAGTPPFTRSSSLTPQQQPHQYQQQQQQQQHFHQQYSMDTPPLSLPAQKQQQQQQQQQQVHQQTTGTERLSRRRGRGDVWDGHGVAGEGSGCVAGDDQDLDGFVGAHRRGLPGEWPGGWKAAAALVQQLQQQWSGRGSSSKSPSASPTSGILQPPWRPPGIASPPKSRSASPDRATPPRRTSFTLGYYGPDHDDDARLFLEPASASGGKKRRVAASGSQGGGGQQLSRSLALLANTSDTPGGQRLQLPPSLIHEVLAYPSAKTVGLTGGRQRKAKAGAGTAAAAGRWGDDFRKGGLSPATGGGVAQDYTDIFGWPSISAKTQSPGFSHVQVGVPSPQDSGN